MEEQLNSIMKVADSSLGLNGFISLPRKLAWKSRAKVRDLIEWREQIPAPFQYLQYSDTIVFHILSEG